jgi:hypothetical protein
MTIEQVLRETLEKILASVDAPGLRSISAESNLFENLDSFTVVDMLLEAEMQLEKSTGRYVTLADETIFDASKSPLRSWASWVAYVEGKHAG